MFFRGVEERKYYLKMERVNVLLTWVHQLSWLFLELRHEFATASQRSKETFAWVLMGAGEAETGFVAVIMHGKVRLAAVQAAEAVLVFRFARVAQQEAQPLNT